MNWRHILLIGGVLLAAPACAANVPAALDPDRDGTVSLDEAETAAGALFDKLDKDHEGTLDIKELRGRVSKGDFGGADPDADKTLTKDEYLGLVEKRFNEADTQKDGTLDARELHSRAGKALMKLLK